MPVNRVSISRVVDENFVTAYVQCFGGVFPLLYHGIDGMDSCYVEMSLDRGERKIRSISVKTSGPIQHDFQIFVTLLFACDPRCWTADSSGHRRGKVPIPREESVHGAHGKLP